MLRYGLAGVVVVLASVSVAAAVTPPTGGGREARGEIGRLMQADANGDGRVTKEEIRTQRGAMFDRIDANSDGFVEASEAPQRRRQRPQTDGAPQGAGLMRFDTNADGKVSRAEFVDRGFDTFDRIDANKDGAVDQQELAAVRGNRRGGASKG